MMGLAHQRLHPTSKAVQQYPIYTSPHCCVRFHALVQPLLGSSGIQQAQHKAAITLRLYRKGQGQQQE